MKSLTIKTFEKVDERSVRKAVVDLQDYERAFHDTRLPGKEIADRYLASIIEAAAKNSGVILVGRSDSEFVGFVACWVIQEDNVAETKDSRKYGYISDVYVVPEKRGYNIASELIAAAEQHLSRQGITRLRIGALAANISAQSAYKKSGFVPYEVIFEKPIGIQDENEILWRNTERYKAAPDQLLCEMVHDDGKKIEIWSAQESPEEAKRFSDLALRSKIALGYKREALEASPFVAGVNGVKIEYLKHPREQYFVAKIEGTTVGFASIGPSTVPNEKGLVLHYLFVDDGFQGYGVGTVLWNHITATVRNIGWKSFMLEAEPKTESFFLNKRCKPVRGSKRLAPLQDWPDRTIQCLRRSL